MFAMLSEDPKLDISKSAQQFPTIFSEIKRDISPRCVMMALVHDLAEAQGIFAYLSEICACSVYVLLKVGDIAPRENIPKAEKHRLEAEAMHNFVHDMLHDSPAAQRISSLWLVSYNTFREVYESHRS